MEARKLYIIEDTKKEIEQQNEQIQNKKKRLAIYYLKQKLCGLVMLVIGISLSVIEKDCTFGLFLAAPIGLRLMFTKNRITTFKI